MDIHDFMREIMKKAKELEAMQNTPASFFFHKYPCTKPIDQTKTIRELELSHLLGADVRIKNDNT